ncbi:MAG: nuclease-related domain-containing protein [Rhodothermus sp.]|nr:nuclease-related domain-containing protein [Rhodothermus sp.]
MIPPYIPRGYSSIPETHLFYMLQNAGGTESWTVLHSLDIMRHRSRISGEIDFLVIVPGQGVLCVEVKGRTRRDERGFWYYGNDPEPDPVGPFKQVRESMYSLMSWVREQNSLFGAIPFTYAVFFPVSIFQVQSPEWEDWQVVDARKLATTPLSELIPDIIRRGTERVHLLPPSPEDPCWRELSRILRPAFETVVERHAPDIDEELLDILEGLDVYSRVLFTGAAGTGKNPYARTGGYQIKSHM